MYQNDELIKKWQPVLEHPDLEKIADAHKRATVATLLENQEKSAREQAQGSGGYHSPSLLGEAAPANAMGGSSSVASAGNVDIYDPWVNPNEEKSNYKHGIIENPFNNNKKYDAIIVAVAHKQFKELTENDYKNISYNIPIIMDIKGIVKNPNWRL